MRGLLPIVTAIAIAAGCASSKPMYDDGRTRAERVAACELKCAPLTYGLLEFELYEEAEPALRIAEEHLQNPKGRIDIPVSEKGRLVMQVELAAARMVVERHVNENQAPDLKPLTKQVAQLVQLGAVSSVDLSFLPMRDRIWLRKRLVSKTTPSNRLEFAVLIGAMGEVVQASSLPPIEKSVSTPAQREAFAFVLCAAKQCSGNLAIENISKLIDQVLAQPSDEGSRYLDGYGIAMFVRHAGPEHAEQIVRLLKYAEDHSGVSVSIPQRAFPENEKCTVVARHTRALLSRFRRSSRGLLEIAQCMFRLDRSGLATQLRKRAAMFAQSDDERLDVAKERLLVYAINNAPADRFRGVSKALRELGASKSWIDLARLAESVASGIEPSSELWESAEPSDALLAIEARWMRAVGDEEQALSRLNRIRARYHRSRVHQDWAELMIVVRREAELRSWLEEVSPTLSPFDRAVLAGIANHPKLLRAAVAELDVSQPNPDFALIALHMASVLSKEEALTFHKNWTRFLTREEQLRYSIGIGMVLQVLEGPEGVLASIEDRDSKFQSRFFSIWQAAGCPIVVAEEREERLSENTDSVFLQNSLSWCHALAGRWKLAEKHSPEVANDKISAAAADTYAIAKLGVGDYDEAQRVWGELEDYKQWAPIAEIASDRKMDPIELERFVSNREIAGKVQWRLFEVHFRELVRALEDRGMTARAAELRESLVTKRIYPDHLALVDEATKDAWEHRWQRRWPGREAQLSPEPLEASSQGGPEEGP